MIFLAERHVSSLVMTFVHRNVDQDIDSAISKVVQAIHRVYSASRTRNYGRAKA